MTELKRSLKALQKKAKERTVKTQTIEYDLETLVKKIKRNVIRLNPEYQRKYRWNDETSSKLIESLVLNIPIPIIYISQDIDVDVEIDDDDNEVSRYSVIDGQQRLTAIFNFLSKKYCLKGLEVLTELNGSYYKDLPPFLIRRLEERTIRCLRIDSTVDTQVKYDIFERLNSGALKLEGQELRNATCRGPFKDLIKLLAKNEDFVVTAKLTKNSARVKKMEDEELVLRYFAITHGNGYKEYKGKFKNFLTIKMDEFNRSDDALLNEMERNFKRTIKKIRQSFGDNPFQKFRYRDDKFVRMSLFNAAVFDAVVYSFSRVRKNVNPTYKNFKQLFADQDFFDAIQGSVNDYSKIEKRISKAKKVIIQ